MGCIQVEIYYKLKAISSLGNINTQHNGYGGHTVKPSGELKALIGVETTLYIVQKGKHI
jgi:hypothetical protein